MEEWFRRLYDTTGIKLTILYDAGDRLSFLKGFLVSLELMAICLVGSLAIGLLGVWLQGSRSGIARRLVAIYIQFFRNTPPLIQLYFFFFALGGVLRVPGPTGKLVPLLSNFTWATLCLSIVAGAFNIEIFRAGIEAVPRATIEAARALGLKRWQYFSLVVLPLAFRICLPALNNNLVNLLKSTTLAYAIAVPELLYVSAQIWSDELNVPEMMTVLLVVFVALVSVLVAAMHRWERRMRIPGYGT